MARQSFDSEAIELKFWSSIFLLALCASSGDLLADESLGDAINPYGRHDVIVEHNVMVPMRDGVRLATDIYRPAKAGQFPVILTRDPYDNGSYPEHIDEGHFWAEKGYVFIHQDVRGRYDSEGDFYTYSYEIEDGYDTQEWAGTQTWSNGRVGMLGGSYLASTQWLSAHLRSQYVEAIAPRMTPFNYYLDVAFPGGAFALSSRIGWAALMGGRTNQIRGYNWGEMLRHLPLKTMDRALGVDLPHWRDWIAHPSYDSYWQEFDVESRIEEIDVPAYSIAGWYDAFLRGNLVSFEGIRERGLDERARSGQKLIVGPWPHTASPDAVLGELDFGADSVVDFNELHVQWFDYWLRDKANNVMDEAPVRIFVMGENKWRNEQEWPLSRTVYTKYYFHSGGNANSKAGDGLLSTSKPSSNEPVDSYTYDPRDPVPTLGGNLMFKTTPAGPFDQSEIEKRDDVLVYTTPPLAADTEVTGPIQVTLFAQSSAVDTDFTAKLVDVHENGNAYNLADGIVRARYRESFVEPNLLDPNKVYEYTIDLWATSNLFKKGHKIRLEVSSSNFPKYDRNPNTGSPFGEDTELKSAAQTIYHTRLRPSHVTLPIIPRHDD